VRKLSRTQKLTSRYFTWPCSMKFSGPLGTGKANLRARARRRALSSNSNSTRSANLRLSETSRGADLGLVPDAPWPVGVARHGVTLWSMFLPRRGWSVRRDLLKIQCWKHLTGRQCPTHGALSKTTNPFFRSLFRTHSGCHPTTERPGAAVVGPQKGGLPLQVLYWKKTAHRGRLFVKGARFE